jgi:hypothetical protein
MNMLPSLIRLVVVVGGVGVLGLVGVDVKGFAHTKLGGHSSNLTAKLTFFDGASQTVVLQGVGCSVGICSRHAIGGRGASDSLVNTWLDTIAAIKETTEDDAVFVLKDGTEQRLSFVHGMVGAHDGRNKQSYTRFLYATKEFGVERTIDLAKVKSVEFLSPERSVRN